MVSDRVKQIIIILIIIAFITEIFIVVFSQGNERQAKTPSPTPEAKEFYGSAFAKARVLELSNSFLVKCNATDAEEKLESLSATLDVFRLSNDLLLVKANATNYSGYYVEMRSILLGECDFEAMREAILEFSEPIELINEKGEKQTIFPRDLDTYSARAGKETSGYVDVKTNKNDYINTIVYAELYQGQLIRVIIQEQRIEVIQPSPSPQENIFITPTPIEESDSNKTEQETNSSH